MRRFEGQLAVEDYLKMQIALDEMMLQEALGGTGADPKSMSVGEAYRLRSELLLSPQLNGGFSYCPFRRHRDRKDKNKWY